MRISPARAKKIRTGVILLLAGSIAGCSYLGIGGADEDSGAYRMIYSPNGEPLRGGPWGRPNCAQAMGAWFDRVDTDKDGRVTLNEFLADARRQFDAMDLDHDGTITPAELDKYRAPYMAVPLAGGGGRAASRQPARNYDAGPDPVMAADTKLRFVVTRRDFIDYADRRLSQLDRNRDKALERDEALKICDTD
jgi:hypothetical protein